MNLIKIRTIKEKFNESLIICLKKGFKVGIIKGGKRVMFNRNKSIVEMMMKGEVELRINDGGNQMLQLTLSLSLNLILIPPIYR